jgi:Predicted dehydrogenases and related proteins
MIICTKLVQECEENMKKLKIGLIGFGSWTRNAYLPALQLDGRAEISAITAASEQTRKKAKLIFGEKVEIYDHYETLLQNTELDAVMIAVPDAMHQTILMAAIASGIPVFYEPPIAITREQLPAMIEQLLRARQVTFADLELGFHPMIMKAIEMIKNKKIGNLHNVTISLNANWGNTVSDMCLIDRMTCWYVEVLNRIMGAIPDRVLILDGYGSEGRMQTISEGIYDYSGIYGVFKANINSPEELSLQIEILGDQGKIEMDYFKGELQYCSLQQKEPLMETCSPLVPIADWPGVRETVSAFLDCILNKEPVVGNAKKVAQLNLIGLAAEESKDTKNWATIKKI